MTIDQLRARITAAFHRDAASPAVAPAGATRPARSEAAETVRFLVKLALFFYLLRALVIAPFVIPSESMLPRLMVGDYLLVTKFDYGWSRWSFLGGFPPVPGHLNERVPTRGDVVVFRSPGPDDHDVIKRVIGLPGDTIQVRGGQVILNAKPIPRDRIADFTIPVTPNYTCDTQFQDVDRGQPICRYRRYRETLPGGRNYAVLDRGDYPQADDTGVYEVPAGTVFLMGDNRDDSADSRFAPPVGMGYIPLDQLEGRAVVTFFSTDGRASWIRPWTWFSAARWHRIGEGF